MKLFDRPLKHRRLGVLLELTKQIIYIIKKETKHNLKFLACVVYFMVHSSDDVVIVVILI